MTERGYQTSAFGLVLFLVGRGYMPLQALMPQDGRGNAIYVFPAAAKKDTEAYYEAKSRLNDLALAARGFHSTPNRAGAEPARPRPGRPP